MGIKPSIKVGQVWKARDGDLEIIEYISHKEIKVRFLATGYERWTWGQSIRNGHVKDRLKCDLDIISGVNVNRTLRLKHEATASRKKLELQEKEFASQDSKYVHVKTGSVWETLRNGKVRVIKEVDEIIVLVYFLNTGHTQLTAKSYVVQGRLVDEKYKNLPKIKKENKILPSEKWIYSRWGGMMGRCYDIRNAGYKHYGEKGVYVTEEWHDYKVYRDWFVENTPGKDYDVDSDLRNQNGQKHYSPEGCTFLPPILNSLLSGEFIENRKWPVGVDYHKPNKRFRARYRKSVNGNRERHVIGYYDNPIDAGFAYAKTREKYLKDTAKDFYKSREIDEEIFNLFLSIDLHTRVEDWIKNNPNWEELCNQ